MRDFRIAQQPPRVSPVAAGGGRGGGKGGGGGTSRMCCDVSTPLSQAVSRAARHTAGASQYSAAVHALDTSTDVCGCAAVSQATLLWTSVFTTTWGLVRRASARLASRYASPKCHGAHCRVACRNMDLLACSCAPMLPSHILCSSSGSPRMLLYTCNILAPPRVSRVDPPLCCLFCCPHAVMPFAVLCSTRRYSSQELLVTSAPHTKTRGPSCTQPPMHSAFRHMMECLQPVPQLLQPPCGC